MLPVALDWLLDPAGLTPHGFCLLWQPGLLWLHAGADFTVGLSYFCIPLVLAVILRRRPDLMFRPIVTLFAAFILLCGAGHWLALLTLWVPAYGLEGIVKAATALVSMVTAIALWKLKPQLLAFPSPLQLRQANAECLEAHKSELRADLAARVAAEQQAAEARDRRAAEAINHQLNHLARSLVAARDRAEQASRAKSRFLAGMSHELRTPLNAIIGQAHMLRIAGGLAAEQSERLDGMLQAGSHLLDMINSVLSLSEIETEQLVLRSVEVDIEAVAETCLDLVRPMAEAKGLSVDFWIAPGTNCKLTTDPTRLRQIFLNLLGNAVKYTHRGSIALRLRQPAGRSALRIEVADTGPGISAENRHCLFQEFERLDFDANHLVEGTGLGLALSSRLAAMMCGEIGHDDNPGGGSVFWLEFPVITTMISPTTSAPAPIAAGEPAMIGTAPRPTEPYQILVVDDVEMNRTIASFFLRNAGHAVVCVDTGMAAVAAAAHQTFDVILLDVRMPGMDGMETARQIRALAGERGRVPIVALTAQAFTEQVQACRAAGMNHHLSKPFDPDTLLSTVTDAARAKLSNPVDQSLTLDKPPAPMDTIADVPIINLKEFNRMVTFLPPQKVHTYLRTIVGLSTDFLAELQSVPNSSADLERLADSAHRLSGSAAMFGFERAPRLGLEFERAVQTCSAELPAITRALAAAIEATLTAIHDDEICNFLEAADSAKMI
jgi:signal transduction histidine kinase/DNA-binding NarL/FixJ family response regulator